MLTLDQLPFQAEGYRDLVCLITNYGRWHCGPTIGSRRRGEGWDCDIAIALSQTCRAIHAWYYSVPSRPRYSEDLGCSQHLQIQWDRIANFLLLVAEYRRQNEFLNMRRGSRTARVELMQRFESGDGEMNFRRAAGTFDASA